MNINKIKKALELLRKKEWEACDYTSNANEAAELLEQAIATEESSATQEPVAWISAKQLSGMHIDPRFNLVQWETTLTVSKTHDGQIPLYTHPQPNEEQDEVDIRSRLYQRVHELETLLKDIAEYTGEGPSTTDWQGIVRLISDSARSALGEEI